MGLTSPALSFLLAALGLGLLLAILFGWMKLSRSGLRTIALRAASLLALQACVLSLIFVTVNRAGEFYSSWSDLLGSDNGQGSVVVSARAGASAIRPVVVTGRVPVRVPGVPAAGGTLDTVRFTGQLSGLTVIGHVFLPVGYRPGGPARYPVIVDISNDAGSTSSPYGAVRLSEDAARLIAARQLGPVIIAMLPAGLSAADQGCLNVPAGAAASGVAQPAVEAGSFFSQDLPGMLESGFRADSSLGRWALLGDSSGGYCALQLTLANSWVFSVAVAPDGDYSQPPGSNEDAGSPQFKQQENLLWLLQNQPMQPVSVLFTGSGLGSGGGQAAPFLTLSRSPMRVATATLGSGSWPLDGVLKWISGAIGADRPAAGRAPRAAHARHVAHGVNG